VGGSEKERVHACSGMDKYIWGRIIVQVSEFLHVDEKWLHNQLMYFFLTVEGLSGERQKKSIKLYVTFTNTQLRLSEFT
jgi:hypothetical protein